MRFWDASALVPLCINEPQTDVLRSLVRGDPIIVVWWGSGIECISALVRRIREGAIASQVQTGAYTCLRTLMLHADEVSPSEDVRSRAEQLLATYPLRAGDALQLAAALMWASNRTSGLEFVCLDDRLRQAAASEGFLVMP